MKLRTFIRAGRIAANASFQAFANGAVKIGIRKCQQAGVFFNRAIALADEQDQLIALQAAELDGFMRVMREAQ